MSRSKGRKNIVIIGGGTGLSTLLRGLKKFPVDITAIVTVADDGGSSGRLGDDYSIPPPGDIRKVMAALSEVEPLVEEMFQYRFSNSPDLAGHSLGNLMLTALTDITGDFSHAIREMSRVLNVNGTVLPAANQRITLHAELEDGTIVTGESKIPTYNQRIYRVFLTPNDVQALPDAIRAIQKADLIVFGPGSLYTSILPNLLVEDIKKAILASSAPNVYVCNLMTQAGETQDYSAADHVRALMMHMGAPFIHTILLNTDEAPADVQRAYEEEQSKPVSYDESRLIQLGISVVKKDIATIREGAIRHDAYKVAEWLVAHAENGVSRR
ncbi:gluconeogenesis factor YvcK family protein [Paenisporosarcina cavernae]|uniref:Gluconeogenesis factor n=1 Tax=Paenisporosarcina cavernae TaxID=2320858 RepID=A0A385YX35_9BACL|nr:YvcK family protein [Paenisporosarcina cavernae]AYC30113.1 YvcK family protein [Paenisporosarcina cavernae]